VWSPTWIGAVCATPRVEATKAEAESAEAESAALGSNTLIVSPELCVPILK
jgi:hypothetical protein